MSRSHSRSCPVLRPRRQDRPAARRRVRRAPLRRGCRNCDRGRRRAQLLHRGDRRGFSHRARQPGRSPGPGSSFGEVALVDKSARSATVTATTPMVACALPIWTFRPFIEERPELAWKLLETLAGMLRSAQSR
ncbi:MAG: Crp/Fnr family transcriptional regulator [Thermoleophilia bacterium]|nr:Crp/Fnr family transcriptional regulator [Thermoleophilia bacterium]